MEIEYFEEYDNSETFGFILSRLKRFGFVDTTWRNDLCPSVGRELPNGDWIRIWIDYRNPELRDIPEAPTLSVTWEDECNTGFECPSSACKLAIHLELTLGRS